MLEIDNRGKIYIPYLSYKIYECHEQHGRIYGHWYIARDQEGVIEETLNLITMKQKLDERYQKENQGLIQGV